MLCKEDRYREAGARNHMQGSIDPLHRRVSVDISGGAEMRGGGNDEPLRVPVMIPVDLTERKEERKKVYVSVNRHAFYHFRKKRKIFGRLRAGVPGNGLTSQTLNVEITY